MYFRSGSALWFRSFQDDTSAISIAHARGASWRDAWQISPCHSHVCVCVFGSGMVLVLVSRDCARLFCENTRARVCLCKTRCWQTHAAFCSATRVRLLSTRVDAVLLPRGCVWLTQHAQFANTHTHAHMLLLKWVSASGRRAFAWIRRRGIAQKGGKCATSGTGAHVLSARCMRRMWMFAVVAGDFCELPHMLAGTDVWVEERGGVFAARIGAVPAGVHVFVRLLWERDRKR